MHATPHEREGVPRTVTKEPFLVTIETEKARISGLMVSLAEPLRRRGAKKK